MPYAQENIKPYSRDGEKREQVEEMFDHIAPTYDSLNHLMSLGIDRGWRRKSIDALKPHHPQHILDIATGTGDFALMAAKRLGPKEIIGADISEGMMEVGRKKVAQAGMQDIIAFQAEDCTRLSFPDARFDAVTIAFGARNFQDLDAALAETFRVLTAGGHLLLLELCAPPRFPMKQLFWLYSRIVMPLVGRIISHDSTAYTYLPSSMQAFPQAEVMEGILRKAGYASVEWQRFTMGICTMYLTQK
ncbi:MAG: bifunctional demethylmenaquinone methyltransferase/2-methoxy-6-polyprenyl-1,4-benzoquinol methylase UbiE [Bacteroidaceae bacterium]|nr:bifunctional demethylmenaquinone methyltransferase/2-methoxy-6-polyprenyl-1,4-benzoquinol methylase UbiE [Bacteroidaceae bacterium]